MMPVAPTPFAGGTQLDAFVAAQARSPRLFADEARRAAEQLVASSLVVPVLAQLHEGPFRSELFAPGSAERRFAPMLDQHLADRITASGRFPIVDAIADRLSGRDSTERLDVVI